MVVGPLMARTANRSAPPPPSTTAPPCSVVTTVKSLAPASSVTRTTSLAAALGLKSALVAMTSAGRPLKLTRVASIATGTGSAAVKRTGSPPKYIRGSLPTYRCGMSVLRSAALNVSSVNVPVAWTNTGSPRLCLMTRPLLSS